MHLKLSKWSLGLLAGLVLSFALGLLFYSFYNTSSNYVVDYKGFTNVLRQKEIKADKTIDLLKARIETTNHVDSLATLDFGNEEIYYYVYEKNQLVFWTTNLIAPSNGIDFQENTTNHIKLPNNCCVYICKAFGEMKIVALIVVKYTYIAETEILKNHFVRDFHTGSNIVITPGNASDNYAVSSADGHYLFSLNSKSKSVYGNVWLYAAYFAFLTFFVLFFIIYALIPKLVGKETFSLKMFAVWAITVGVGIFVLLYCNIPKGYFKSAGELSAGYAVCGFISTLEHFIVFTLYCVSTIYMYQSTSVERRVAAKKWVKIVLQFVFFAYFVLFFYFLQNIVAHSTNDLSILNIDDLNYSKVCFHILIFLWGLGTVSLFSSTFRWMINKKNDYIFVVLTNFVFLLLLFVVAFVFFPDIWLQIILSYAGLLAVFLLTVHYYNRFFPYSNFLNSAYIAVMTMMVVFNVFIFEKSHRNEFFLHLAENIVNGNSEENILTNAQLVDLDAKLKNDSVLIELIAQNDANSILAAEDYIEAYYSNNILTNYESKIFVYKADADNIKLLREYGTQIAQTDFYRFSTPQSANAFVGIFSLPHQDLAFVLNLEQTYDFRSYSFPNLLIDHNEDEHSQQRIATAKYHNGNLADSEGRYIYPPTSRWFPTVYNDWESFSYNGKKHYLLRTAENTVAVITDLRSHSFQAYLVYFFYLFLAYFLAFWLCAQVVAVYSHRRLTMNIITRFQYLFFTLFLLCFLGVFIVSSDFLKNRYRTQKIETINEKATYIQKILQEKYFYVSDLNNSYSTNLTAELQDLSYTFQTDIHVYDNSGMLISTTQPLMFSKNLISRRISPKIYFTNKNNLNENAQIGQLNYMVTHSEFFNGDNLQIGYISVPQYFSEIDLKAETQNYLYFIIHLYVIAFVLSLIVSNIIRQRLYAPLQNLEKKLGKMRIGQHNEKIEYNGNDEIKQLVNQYNHAVDELERSAQLLKQSERESAWQLMARQIAHEINNPLTPMKLSLQHLQRMKTLNNEQFDTYFDKSTKILVEQIDNLSRIAGTFSNFAKIPEAKFETTNLTEKLASVVELFCNNNEQVQVDFIYPQHEVFVFADPEQLTQVFNNLLKNAIQAIPKAQKIKTVSVVLTENAEYVKIDVTDNGMGISDDVADKLFVPSFTTKSTGTGLGLAISKNIVETAGGIIHFTSKKGKGATFTVELPKVK
ncbi:MAG: HAMP domain-containing histidine kinase [Prevotellaceae bacterium]|jgi:signal transduction histidine kinase|nr:HAMP domain-containing histidine kinase [Prevotellaceae bacterium]